MSAPPQLQPGRHRSQLSRNEGIIMRAARASTLYAVLLLLPLLLSGCSRNEAVYRTQGIWLIQFGALARLCAAVGPATAREALLMGAAWSGRWRSRCMWRSTAATCGRRASMARKARRGGRWRHLR